MKQTFKEIIAKIKEIEVLLPIILSCTFAFTQILGYVSQVSYLNYFNINKEFYHFNIFNDLIPLFINFMIYSIFILTIVGLSIYLKHFFVQIFEGSFANSNYFIIEIFNRELKIYRLKDMLQNIKRNINSIYSIHGLLRIFLGTLIIILLISMVVTYLFQGSFKGVGETTLTLFIVSIIYSLFPLLIKNKEKDDTSYDAGDIIFNIIFMLLALLGLMFIANIRGFTNAKYKTTFNIINDNMVILYNHDSNAMVTTFEYDDKTNDIIIDINQIKYINIEDYKIIQKQFNNVYRKGIDK